MRSRSLLILLLALLPAAVAWGQERAAKIGYVNLNIVVESAPQIALAKDRLDDEFRPSYESIEEREGELRRLEERWQRDSAIMSQSETRTLEQRIRALRRDVQRDREDLADELDFRLNEMRQRVEDEIYEILRQFALENDYDLILPGPALYASEAIDLTDELLARLRTDFAAAEESDAN